MEHLEHIAELQDLMQREVAHEGDSVLYVRLAMRAIEVRTLARRLMKNPQAGDEDTVDELMREETHIYASMADARKITQEQKSRLFLLLTQDHVPQDEPRVLKFPVRGAEPPRAA
jgi:hypothetical protein